MRRAESIRYETGECVTAQYSIKDNGYVRVDNNQYFGFYDGSDSMRGGEGEAWINNWFSGLLFVTFFGNFGGGYRVLSTDYDTYTMVYSCENFAANAYIWTEDAWILTRDQIVPGSADYDAVMETVSEVYAEKLPDYDHLSLMRDTQQGTGCEYFTVESYD